MNDLGYKIVHLTEDPEKLDFQTLYVIGENGNFWHVMFNCPCGCGAVIALNLLPDASPQWKLNENGPTLTPSINRTTGCRSHFILRNGQINWS